MLLVVLGSLLSSLTLLQGVGYLKLYVFTGYLFLQSARVSSWIFINRFLYKFLSTGSPSLRLRFESLCYGVSLVPGLFLNQEDFGEDETWPSCRFEHVLLRVFTEFELFKIISL